MQGRVNVLKITGFFNCKQKKKERKGKLKDGKSGDRKEMNNVFEEVRAPQQELQYS